MTHSFKSWFEQDFMEMAARRSFWRSMSKYIDGESDKPAAIVTAFRDKDDYKNANKNLNTRQVLAANRKANKRLERNLQNRGFSFHPVFGAGQEIGDGEKVKVVKEESYIIQPMREMSEEEFVRQVKEIIFDPAMEGMAKPFHTQWGGLVKLPSQPKSFMLSHDEATSPSSYTATGTYGTPRTATADDPFFTQMRSGPQASQGMKHPDEGDERIGRRFTLPEE